jgi:hypothetical protein
LTEATLSNVAAQLCTLADDPGWQSAMFERCQSVYRENFSKEAVCDGWDRSLRGLLQNPA